MTPPFADRCGLGTFSTLERSNCFETRLTAFRTVPVHHLTSVASKPPGPPAHDTLHTRHTAHGTRHQKHPAFLLPIGEASQSVYLDTPALPPTGQEVKRSRGQGSRVKGQAKQKSNIIRYLPTIVGRYLPYRIHGPPGQNPHTPMRPPYHPISPSLTFYHPTSLLEYPCCVLLQTYCTVRTTY